MALIKISRRKKPIPRDEVVSRIHSFIERQNEKPTFSEESLTISWQDGLSLEEFYDEVLEGTNWELRAKDANSTKEFEDGVVFAARTLSTFARAIAVVRFAGAKSRPLNLLDPSDHDFFTSLLREGVHIGKWQMAELMAKYLVELTEEPKSDEMLANKFTEVGYERLWNRAFSEMT
ncbi:MAG: hypothetical protein M0019_02500 [Actinomycetota bacterium]|nr:hypothetical protein [Actinomycetota bacterium]